MVGLRLSSHHLDRRRVKSRRSLVISQQFPQTLYFGSDFGNRSCSDGEAVKVHLQPAFGRKRLDRIGYAQIQDQVVGKQTSLANTTINHHLIVLQRLRVAAKKRDLIEAVPEVEWLDAPRPKLDFFDFKEAATPSSGHSRRCRFA